MGSTETNRKEGRGRSTIKRESQATTERVQVLAAQWCGGKQLGKGAAKARVSSVALLTSCSLAPLMNKKLSYKARALAGQQGAFRGRCTSEAYEGTVAPVTSAEKST